MLRRSKEIGLALAFVAVTGMVATGAHAQHEAGLEAVLEVETNAPQATLFADGIRLGTASERTFRLAPGTRTLRLVVGEADGWSVEPRVETVVLAPGDTARVRLDVPYHYRIESVPFGAQVYLDDAGELTPLGETPLTLRREAPLQTSLLIDEPGYARMRLTPGQEVWNRHAVLLAPVDPAGEVTTPEVAWSPPTQRLRWFDYAALGAGLGAGVLSIHYKFKADRRYDRYVETTDPTLRDEIRSYDVRAGVALGAMQVGVGFFALRLALR